MKSHGPFDDALCAQHREDTSLFLLPVPADCRTLEAFPYAGTRSTPDGTRGHESHRSKFRERVYTTKVRKITNPCQDSGVIDRPCRVGKPSDQADGDSS